ncbi:hypothetical protein [Pleomorphomonas koreensis]|uniref:hypothetical protein n=1 Tax=Pleomorphomonas koreensis TaxID=257440 RepID=UPI00041ACC7C|nr:hypothetical protein [Pleomorphomonas koreensis]
MIGNSKGVSCDLVVEFRIYDGFPPEIREVLRRAPDKYKVSGKIAKMVRADPVAARRQLIDGMCLDVMRQTRKLYGPDHPQATEPFPGWRPS